MQNKTNEHRSVKTVLPAFAGALPNALANALSLTNVVAAPSLDINPAIKSKVLKTDRKKKR